MERVAHHLDVTKPVVYACYGSRCELLTALLEREEQRVFEGLVTAFSLLPQSDLHDVEQMFAEGFEAVLTMAVTHPLVFARNVDPAISERYGQARRRVVERVTQLMALARAGEADLARKLPVLAELLISMGEAAVHRMLDSNGEWTAPELGRLVGRVARGGFKSV